MTFPLTDSMYNMIRILYKKTKDKRSANSLNIVLLKHKGYPQKEIADILNLDENTICTWVSKFEKSTSIDDYLILNYTSYGGKLPAHILPEFDSFVEKGCYRDVGVAISETKKRFGVHYGASGMAKILKRMGFSYKQKVALPSKLDPSGQVLFVAEYKKIEMGLTEKCAVFFMDAVHPQHNTHTIKAWLRKGKPSYILSNSGRNRLNINGLYNPHTQEAIVTYHKTINAQAVMETFGELLRLHPSKENLYVFADNAKYYVSAVLKEYLAANPRIILKHLPAYSPNLNLIERLWKYLRKEAINPVYHEKFESFSDSIKNFFSNIHYKKEELSKFIGLKFRMFDFA